MVLPHLGALRYHATLVPTGTRAALLALVGGSEVRVAPLYEEGTLTLFIEGDEGDIDSAAGSGGAGRIVLCLLIGLPAALGLWLKARAIVTRRVSELAAKGAFLAGRRPLRNRFFPYGEGVHAPVSNSFPYL